MKVHVICCNDGVEFAVVGDEAAAKRKLAQLRKDGFNKCKHLGEHMSFEEYKGRLYWHIHTVEGERA